MNNWTEFLTHENELIRNACKQAIETGNPPIIDGDLNLRKTLVTKLPNNLKVKGNLDLAYTPITSLPEGLEVEGHLDLACSSITSFPTETIIGTSLNFWGTSLTWEQIRQSKSFRKNVNLPRYSPATFVTPRPVPRPTDPTPVSSTSMV